MTSAKARLINEIFKTPRRRFPRRQTVIKSLNDLIQMDLCEFQTVAKENRGVRYLLTAINCFSKKSWALPIKTKTASEVATAAEIILDDSKRLIGSEIMHIQTDQGSEFKGAFASLCKSRGIKHYWTHSPLKAAIVERFNKTLKMMIHKRMAALSSLRYIDFLPDILEKYNNTRHSKTGMTPNQASKRSKERFLQQNVYKNTRPRVTTKYSVGDSVRVSNPKLIFSRGFHPQYSPELYKIHLVNRKYPPTYILKNWKDEIVPGTFYQNELQKTSDPDLYLIEKVLQKKGSKIKVRWLGYGQEADSWINSSDFVQDNAD